MWVVLSAVGQVVRRVGRLNGWIMYMQRVVIPCNLRKTIRSRLRKTLQRRRKARRSCKKKRRQSRHGRGSNQTSVVGRTRPGRCPDRLPTIPVATNQREADQIMTFTREHSGDRLQHCMIRFNAQSHELRAQDREITTLKEALRVSRGTVERLKNILGLE